MRRADVTPRAGVAELRQAMRGGGGVKQRNRERKLEPGQTTVEAKLKLKKTLKGVKETWNTVKRGK